MNEVLLTSTLHDPRGVFLDVVKNTRNVVLEGYKGWVVNVTTATNQQVKNTLKALAPSGVYMTETDTQQPIVADKVENDHLYLLGQTLQIARQLGICKVQYTDGDRIITAANHYPKDLLILARRASELLANQRSYANFRRSAKDYFSHHPPLVQTEFEFNRLYSEVFGIPIDIGSTSHGMSIDVIEEILRRSPQMEAVSFPHPKWLIIARGMGASIKSEETQNVLTFETPYQFMKEAAALPYEKVQQDYMATLGLDSTLSIKEWDLRFNTERQYLSLLRNHLNIFGLDEGNERGMRDEINRCLVSMEGRQRAIEQALRQSTRPEGK